MSKSKLLKEAIADAKAVRETALANAKLALEEAFTPKLQSMLSKKIQQEMEGEDEEGTEDEENPTTTIEADNAEDAGEDVAATHDEPDADNTDEMYEGDDEDADDMSGDADATDTNEAEYGSEDGSEDTDGSDDELDLEAVIKELEGSDDESGEGEAGETNEGEEGEGDEEGEEMPTTESDDADADDEKELSIEEIVKALREEDGDEDEDEEETVAAPGGDMTAENKKLQAELAEAYATIEEMRSSLNETNLLNAKLLFSNKLFRAYNLNEKQKVKVIENFDRAQNMREVKLVFATLAESFTMPVKSSLKESVSSSKTIAGTAPKKVISEGTELAERFRKLANITKK